MAAHHLIAAAPAVADEKNPLAISGGQYGVVVVIGVIALLALGFASLLVKEVLKADQGTPKMQEIGQAVQQGAAAYLNRQFRTLAVFSVIVFVLLLILPVNHGGFSIQLLRGYLYVESWIRVVGGSGQAHVITHEGVVLVQEGFG